MFRSKRAHLFASVIAALPWAVLVLGLLVSLVGWQLSRERQMQAIEAEFRSRAAGATAEIRTRLLGYVQLLRGAGALMDATRTVSRSQWRAYVDRLSLGQSFPDVEGIGFAKSVTAQDKDTHIATIRAEGLPDYDIHPVGQRDIYYPVIYLEPEGKRDSRLLGDDLFVDPVQRNAMERARDFGTPAMSGKVAPPNRVGDENRATLVLYLPLYRGGHLPVSVAGRRAELIGFAYAPFRMENLMGGTLGPQADSIDLEIFDGAVPTNATLMFDRDRIPHFLDNPGTIPLSFTSVLDLNGQSWTLRYVALPAFFVARIDQTPVIVLSAGILISVLLFGLTWAASRTRSQALALAEKMAVTLVENEQRFTGIFHSAMDAIITIDHDQRILHFNPAAEQVFRCSAAQATGSPLTRFLPQRFRDAHEQHVERFGKTGSSDRQMGKQLDLYGLREDGEEFPLEASISHTVQQGKILYTVILRDISARRHAEAAVRNSEKRFRGLIEVSPEAIYIHQDEIITFVNHAAQKLFGATSPDELVGKSVYSLFHPDLESTVREVIKSLLAGVLSTPILERKIVRLDGEIRFVEVAVSVFDDGGKRACQGIMRDVTDRYLARAELERSHAELRQLSIALETAQEEERKRIARELHDDLGQHLTVLKMEMSNLKAKLKHTATHQATFASLLDDTERMDGLLNHTVQSIRRISTDLRPLMLDDLGLATALEALINQVSRSSNIHCTFTLDPDRLSIDQRLATPLYRIAQEALNNIVKHSQATEANLNLYRDAASSLILEIRDNGKGITPENRRKAASFGLIGMRERVYALGGELQIDGQPGSGARIRVIIPSSGNGPKAESEAQQMTTSTS
jgi:PAS domain S-box-containing protein